MISRLLGFSQKQIHSKVSNCELTEMFLLSIYNIKILNNITIPINISIINNPEGVYYTYVSI